VRFAAKADDRFVDCDRRAIRAQEIGLRLAFVQADDQRRAPRQIVYAFIHCRSSDRPPILRFAAL
jgi:hypothetical protein